MYAYDDVCVVGGGIVGLYTALRLAREENARVVILEERHAVGGRLRIAHVNGVGVPEGAGVLRADKDYRLARLAAGFPRAAPDKPSPVRYAYARPLASTLRARGARDAPTFIRTCLAVLNRATWDTAGVVGRETFSALGRRVLGLETYDLFVRLVGFSDFENADALDTLATYEFDDNYEQSPPRRVSKMPWDKLVAALRDACKRAGVRILTGVRATALLPPRTGLAAGEHDTYTIPYVATTEGRTRAASTTPGEAKARLVCVCTPIPAMARFLSGSAPPRVRGADEVACIVSDQVRPQTFVRVYAHVEGLRGRVKRTTIVGNAAQKIIPVSPQKDVYMAAYADNQRADDVLERIFRGRAHAHAPAGCTDETRRPDVMRAVADIIREGLAEALPGLRVRAVRWAAWRAGTHYFAPLDTTRFPTREAFLQWSVEPVRRVFLAGECLCQRQGWTEGALERVEDAVLPAAKQALSHDDIKK